MTCWCKVPSGPAVMPFSSYSGRLMKLWGNCVLSWTRANWANSLIWNFGRMLSFLDEALSEPSGCAANSAAFGLRWQSKWCKNASWQSRNWYWTRIEHGKQSPLDGSSSRYWPGSIAWQFHVCLAKSTCSYQTTMKQAGNARVCGNLPLPGFEMWTARWSQEPKSLQFAGSMKATVGFGGSHVDSFTWPVSARSRSI